VAAGAIAAVGFRRPFCAEFALARFLNMPPVAGAGAGAACMGSRVESGPAEDCGLMSREDTEPLVSDVEWLGNASMLSLV